LRDTIREKFGLKEKKEGENSYNLDDFSKDLNSTMLII